MQSELGATDILAIHPDMVILARYSHETAELIVYYANPAAERTLGMTLDQIVGRPMRTLLADESPFLSRPQRDAFNHRLRELGKLEFPGLARIRDGRGRRRDLRVRLHWPAGDDVLVICEDMTEQNDHIEHSGALERLRSAIEVSGLLSHHVNNALTGALLSVDTAQMDLRRGEVQAAVGALSRASAGMSTAADVVAALAATTGTETDVEESADLRRVLSLVSASGTHSVPPAVNADESADSYYVWGAASQLEMILKGVMQLLPRGEEGRLCATLSRDEHEVRLELSTRTPGGNVMRMLLDPAEPQPLSDTRAVRLFASLQVLRAIGGGWGLPSWRDGLLAFSLTFRAAPGRISSPFARRRVMVISGDAALRSVISASLPDHRAQFTHSVRDGLVWLMRTSSGVALCDIDELSMPLDELITLQQLAVPRPEHRFVLLSRKPFDSELPVPKLSLPIERTDLLRALGMAATRDGPRS